MTDLMKRKHQLRLIELEESVLLAQVSYQSFCFYLKYRIKRELFITFLPTFSVK